MLDQTVMCLILTQKTRSVKAEHTGINAKFEKLVEISLCVSEHKEPLLFWGFLLAKVLFKMDGVMPISVFDKDIRNP